MKMASINQQDCIGCGACVEICPEVFAFNDDEEKAYVIKPEGGDEQCINEAVASCPAGCISYE